MRKFSLTNLSKNELNKDEAQKIKAGSDCICYCVCYCDCPSKIAINIRAEDRALARREDLFPTSFSS